MRLVAPGPPPQPLPLAGRGACRRTPTVNPVGSACLLVPSPSVSWGRVAERSKAERGPSSSCVTSGSVTDWGQSASFAVWWPTRIHPGPCRPRAASLSQWLPDHRASASASCHHAPGLPAARCTGPVPMRLEAPDYSGILERGVWIRALDLPWRSLGHSLALRTPRFQASHVQERAEYARQCARSLALR